MLKVLVVLLCISSVLSVVPVAMKCPDGWKWWKRSRGGWCMKVFADKQTREAADAACAAQGAVVAGVQNDDEIEWMIDTLTGLLGSGVASKQGLWVGAKRTKKCISSGLTAECTRLNSFYWTDGSATGIQGFKWEAGEPNNGAGRQDCIQIYLEKKTMDDVACVDPLPGYACGKIASFD